MYSQDSQYDNKKITYTSREQTLIAQVRILSESPVDRREGMKELALEIRRLPSGLNKLRIADALAFISTAGDPGHAALQEVATTLEQAMRDSPGQLDSAYLNLARLVHYEHVDVSVTDPAFAAALSRLEADERRRREVDFTLSDLTGKSWSLKGLRGKVVMVAFWASWSRPCWQEMVDLQALQARYKQDLAILAISSDDREHATNFLKSQKLNLTVLLDRDSKVAQSYSIVGVPRTFVYNRQGELVVQALDARTRKQLVEMLKQAGVE